MGDDKPTVDGISQSNPLEGSRSAAARSALSGRRAQDVRFPQRKYRDLEEIERASLQQEFVSLQLSHTSTSSAVAEQAQQIRDLQAANEDLRRRIELRQQATPPLSPDTQSESYDLDLQPTATRSSRNSGISVQEWLAATAEAEPEAVGSMGLRGHAQGSANNTLPPPSLLTDLQATSGNAATPSEHVPRHSLPSDHTATPLPAPTPTGKVDTSPSDTKPEFH